jgi:preprotein translocase subunit Sss1
MSKNEIADLYVIGTEYKFDTPSKKIKVWLQKPNDVDQAKAAKKAGAAQARVLAVLRDPTSDEYLDFVGQAMDMEKEAIVDKILEKERTRVSLAEESKLANADEWADDGYLQGLRDSFRDGLQKEYLANPTDETSEAFRVYSELIRFQKEVNAAIDADMADRHAAKMREPLEDLQDEVVAVLVKDAGMQAFLDEFRRCEVWLGTRVCTHQDHKTPTFHRELYFESRAAVDDLQQLAFLQLSLGIQNITVDGLEGKDSEETPDSSSSSGSPEEQDPGVSSGLVAAPA